MPRFENKDVRATGARPQLGAGQVPWHLSNSRVEREYTHYYLLRGYI
jgi:hypothetical protein